MGQISFLKIINLRFENYKLYYGELNLSLKVVDWNHITVYLNVFAIRTLNITICKQIVRHFGKGAILKMPWRIEYILIIIKYLLINQMSTLNIS